MSTTKTAMTNDKNGSILRYAARSVCSQSAMHQVPSWAQLGPQFQVTQCWTQLEPHDAPQFEGVESAAAALECLGAMIDRAHLHMAGLEMEVETTPPRQEALDVTEDMKSSLNITSFTSLHICFNPVFEDLNRIELAACSSEVGMEKK